MKTPRTDKTVVVIGRNRRSYTRVYRMEKSIQPYALRCFAKEALKARREEYKATNMSLERHDDVYIFRIIYDKLPSYAQVCETMA